MSAGVKAWLAIEPLDTVMIRDGRAADAGTSSTAATVVPLPSTTGGVVGKAVGGRVAGSLIGPLLFRHAPLFPMPHDIVTDDTGRIRRLGVRAIGADETSDLPDDLGFRLYGEGDPGGHYCDTATLTLWCHGTDGLDRFDRENQKRWQERLIAPPWAAEHRVGIGLRGRDAGADRRLTEPGMLYSATHLRPEDDTRWLVGCVTDSDIRVVRDLVAFGGQARMATVTEVEAPRLPPVPAQFPQGRLCVYLATPALLEDTLWRPPEARLCAVALTGPHPVATAAPGQGFWASRWLSWAVPAGTVYYLEFEDADVAADWACRYHGGVLPGQRHDTPLVTAGFGMCLTGQWSPQPRPQGV
ncbi:type III-B CRISPR module-associated Cmr3 family protein [Nocardia lijiangensis]|uniref:type III-B CRISPR module-associated Cmr3 family protein n=1 Tax=Nocardia lijiangensis TaxID=299618 RepID=UPI003D73331A